MALVPKQAAWCDPGSGLSRLQKHILVTLLANYQAVERNGNGYALQDLSGWGIRCRTEGTRAQQASISRALRRLEQRGLILRQNQASRSPGNGGLRHTAEDPHDRRTHILLLPVGREIAERLTKKQSEMLTVPCEEGVS